MGLPKNKPFSGDNGELYVVLMHKTSDTLLENMKFRVYSRKARAIYAKKCLKKKGWIVDIEIFETTGPLKDEVAE